MYTLSKQLFHDEAGFIVSAELVIVGTVLVLGLITGMACVQEALVGEYKEVAGALRGLDQSYYYGGMRGCVSRRCGVTSWTAGSSYGVDNACVEAFGLYTPGPAEDCVDCPAATAPALPVVPEDCPCPSESLPGTPALPPPHAVPVPCPDRSLRRLHSRRSPARPVDRERDRRSVWAFRFLAAGRAAFRPVCLVDRARSLPDTSG